MTEKDAILTISISLESSKTKPWKKLKWRNSVPDVAKKKANKREAKKSLTSKCAADVKKCITAAEIAKRETTEFIRDTAWASAKKKPPQLKRVKNKRIEI